MANEYSFLGPDGGFFDTVPPGQTASGAGLTMTGSNSGQIIALSRAAGTAVTLPKAVGSGAHYIYVCAVSVSGGTTTIKTSVGSNDVLAGFAILMANTGNTASMWKPGASDDTLTLNGTTMGGQKGDTVEVIDVSPGTWWVRLIGSVTTTAVTPFSNTVA